MEYAELIDRLERLPPVNEVTRSIARQDFGGSLEANVDRTTHILACLKRLAGKWTRRHALTGYGRPGIAGDLDCADELLESIEDSEVAIRFVPDWADEPLKNAA